METTKHQRLVQALAEGGAKTAGFTVAVVKAVAGKCINPKTDDDWCDHCDMKRHFKANQVIPDAYVIDVPRMEVVVYEVEVSHQIPLHKMAKLCELFWVLDQDEWLLRLIRVDSLGRVVEEDMFGIAVNNGKEPAELRGDGLNAIRASMGVRPPGEAP